MKTKSIVKAIVCIAALSACQSKFEEKKASGLKPDDKSKIEIQAQADKVASRLRDTKEVLKTINELASSLNLAKGKVTTNLIAHVLDTLEKSEAHQIGDAMITTAEVYLNVPGISEECRSIIAKSTYRESETTISHSVSLKTCKTEGAFKKVFEIKGDDQQGISVVAERVYTKILPDVDLVELLDVQNCRMTKVADGSLASITCNASDLRINDDEFVSFSKVHFERYSDPMLAVEGTVVSKKEADIEFILELDHSLHLTKHKLRSIKKNI